MEPLKVCYCCIMFCSVKVVVLMRVNQICDSVNVYVCLCSWVSDFVSQWERICHY